MKSGWIKSASAFLEITGWGVSMKDNDQTAFLVDAYGPAEIARRVEVAGVAKARLSVIETLTLALLAGAFISFGAMFYTLAVTGSTLGFGPTRVLGGAAFSLGLILVVVGGAELFTGNNLLVMAWADRKISLARLLRNWGLVYLGNFVGAVATAVLVTLSGIYDLAVGEVGQTAAVIAQKKVLLEPGTAFFRGILCNVLVCLAVWLAFGARHVSGKILAILFPITAFVGLGFEHSVANMYAIPVAMMSGADGVTLSGFVENLVYVTLGNVVGGGGFVALVYWIIYGRKA
jgi:formate/nitrite transporter